MTVEVDDGIKEYFEEVKDKYNIPFDHFSMICKAPFLFFRKMMELPELPIINIKYLGKFIIQAGQAKKIINALNRQLSSGVITKEQFDRRTYNLKLHINEDEAENSDDSDGEETPN